MKIKENKENYDIYKEIESWFHGFHQSDIVETYKEYFIIKRKKSICDIEDYEYELWKFNNSTNKMKKINFDNVCYLKIKNKFLIVHKFIKDGAEFYYLDEIYELPNLNIVMKSNALGIDIKDSEDFYIVNELDEDDNGDLYPKRSRLIDKSTKKEVNPYVIRDHNIIRNAHKNSLGDIKIALYDCINKTGFLLSPNSKKKGFKNFCEYDDNKILIYDDLDNAKIVDYEGNVVKKIKININIKEGEKLFIYNFKNGFAKFKIEYNSVDWYRVNYGIIDLNGNVIISNSKYLYMLNNNKYILKNDLNFYLSDIKNKDNKTFIGTYFPKVKNKYIIINDNNNCIFINNFGDIVLNLPFFVNDFNMKDNLIVFKNKEINYLYDLNNKKEIISCPYNITIIDCNTVMINDKIKKIDNQNKKEENQIEEKTDKPKTKFLSKFNFKKRKM